MTFIIIILCLQYMYNTLNIFPILYTSFKGWRSDHENIERWSCTDLLEYGDFRDNIILSVKIRKKKVEITKMYDNCLTHLTSNERQFKKVDYFLGSIIGTFYCRQVFMLILNNIYDKFFP